MLTCHSLMIVSISHTSVVNSGISQNPQTRHKDEDYRTVEKLFGTKSPLTSSIFHISEEKKTVTYAISTIVFLYLFIFVLHFWWLVGCIDNVYYITSGG